MIRLEKISVYTAALLALLLYSCGHEQKEEVLGLKQKLYGNWITRSYSDSLSIRKSVKKMSEDCMELIFKPHSDSMKTIVVGLEIYPLGFDSIAPNTFRVKQFNQEEFTDFVLSDDGKVLSYDYKKFHQKFSFVKIAKDFARQDLHDGWMAGSDYFINQAVIAGEYDELDSKNQNTHKAFSFNVNGTIQGWGKFSSYSICTGGDCASMCDQDLIYLGNGVEDEAFHMRFSADTLLLYRLRQTNPKDEFPIYVADELYMKLKKTEKD